MHYSDFQQRQLDQQSGRELDRRAAGDRRRKLIEEKTHIEDWMTRVSHITDAADDLAAAGERLDEIAAELAAR